MIECRPGLPHLQHHEEPPSGRKARRKFRAESSRLRVAWTALLARTNVLLPGQRRGRGLLNVSCTRNCVNGCWAASLRRACATSDADRPVKRSDASSSITAAKAAGPGAQFENSERALDCADLSARSVDHVQYRLEPNPVEHVVVVYGPAEPAAPGMAHYHLVSICDT
jgi:hypothetical protein